MADDVTLPVLLQSLARRWKITLVVVAAFVGGAVAYAQSLPNEYTAKVVLAFAPRPGTNAGGDTVRVVLPKYVVYATSPATLRRVAQSIGAEPGALGDAVDASTAVDSGNVTIKVKLETPSRASDAANAVATDVLRFSDTDPLLQGVIVAPALPDPVPSGPHRSLLEAAALVVGLLLGVGAALLLERSRPRVRTWRDIGLATGYTVVGRVPPSRSLRGSPVEALADPAVGAAVRTLRTNLERLSRERPVHVLIVTSSLPGEGKTTLSGTLAVTLCRLDANVLLVDADLRKPGVSRLFELGPGPGLSDILQGDASFDEAIRPTSMSGLHVLPTKPDAEAGDLLARGFADVVRSGRDRFDVVVVDAPPLLAGDDARTLTTLCDGVLMVVAANSMASSVSEGAAALDALGVRVLGVVANRIRESRDVSGYGAYGYGVQT